MCMIIVYVKTVMRFWEKRKQWIFNGIFLIEKLRIYRNIIRNTKGYLR